jgi:hypothetical protein
MRMVTAVARDCGRGWDPPAAAVRSALPVREVPLLPEDPGPDQLGPRPRHDDGEDESPLAAVRREPVRLDGEGAA